VRTKQSQEATHETHDFYPVVRPSNTCLLPHCGVPMDEGCTQPLSSDPMIDLNTTVFSFRVFFPVARNLHNLESLALTIEITKKHKSKGGKATHTRLESTTKSRTQVRR
jgi:imidazoleglycerol phosphate dehydratase HisB